MWPWIVILYRPGRQALGFLLTTLILNVERNTTLQEME